MLSARSAMRLTKTVRKLEKPRPLKAATIQNLYRPTIDDGILSSVEVVMTLVDIVSIHIRNGNDKLLQANATILCSNLKIYGSQLEAEYKDQLDTAYELFRNGCGDDRLDMTSRLHLLELVELRARNWMPCDKMNSYYKSKLSNIENEMFTTPETRTYSGMSLPPLGPTSSSTIVQPTLLPPGELINTSGKFAKPTKIPGKNYCKDEVVIGNSDSGKVSPGAKERLVQATGPAEDTNVNLPFEYALRRASSSLEQPDKERVGGSSSNLKTKLLHSLSTNDASLGEYIAYPVSVGNHSLKIEGSSKEDRSAKERLVQATGPAEDTNYVNLPLEYALRRVSSSLEQPDKERVGGSSSNLKTKLLHSLSTNDASLGEYIAYPVSVGNHSLKISGSNFDLVMTAKLVLEYYLTGDPNQYIGAGDFV